MTEEVELEKDFRPRAKGDSRTAWEGQAVTESASKDTGQQFGR